MNSVHALQPVSVPEEAPRSDIETSIRLQNLIPIVMVIVGGCESCAEKMVERALQEGSTTQEVDKTLRIVAGTQKLGCFASAVGPAVIARMEKPLNAGLAALQKAISFMPNGDERGTSRCG